MWLPTFLDFLRCPHTSIPVALRALDTENPEFKKRVNQERCNYTLALIEINGAFVLSR
jgi:hypothetical protein